MALKGSKSEGRLLECAPDLIKVVRTVADWTDLLVLCGHRGETDQMAAYNSKPPTSFTPWPQSRHNSMPAQAVDLAPFPLNWEAINEFYYLAGLMEAASKALEVPIEWGGRWPKLRDMPHFELG